MAVLTHGLRFEFVSPYGTFKVSRQVICVCGAVNGLFVGTRTNVNKIKQMFMKMKSFNNDKK